MLLIWVCFQPFKVGVRQEYPFLNLTAFGVVVGSFMCQLSAYKVFVHIFSSRQYYSIDSRRDLLFMYLPQEAHKSSTAALSFLGGVVYRPATVAVENGSQIADRYSITRLLGKQKRTRFQCFHISWKPLKPSPKLCVLFFSEKLRFACA